MKLIDEFKTFISKGNVLDMAVGIIIGTAFTKIVNSLVTDIITPIIGIISGRIDLSKLAFSINDTVSVKYGSFIQAVIDFLIIAAVVFIMIKSINSVKLKLEKQKEEEPKKEIMPSREELLLTEIRDLLKEKK